MDKVMYANLTKGVSSEIYDKEIYFTIDSLTVKKVLSDFYAIEHTHGAYGSGSICEFIYDVKEAMSKCEFTDTQKKRLDLWTLGFNEQEIAEIENCTRWVVSKTIVSCCNKILEQLRKEFQHGIFYKD